MSPCFLCMILDGKHNGTVKGKAYFKCGDNKGCIVKADKLKKATKIAAAAVSPPSKSAAKEPPKSPSNQPQPQLQSPKESAKESAKEAAAPKPVLSTELIVDPELPKLREQVASQELTIAAHVATIASLQQQIDALVLPSSPVKSSKDGEYEAKIAELEVNLFENRSELFCQSQLESANLDKELAESTVTWTIYVCLKIIAD